MKLITRDTDYSVKALIYIARSNGRVVSITELVDEIGTPRPFLRKILQSLSAEGILKSHKGKNGGFELAKKPENIFLIEIMEIFQGKFKLSECLFKKDICPNINNCTLKSEIDALELMVEDRLKGTTLASLVSG